MTHFNPFNKYGLNFDMINMLSIVRQKFTSQPVSGGVREIFSNLLRGNL